MPKPITPMVGCDIFVLNANRELLLVRRADNGFWALPGGCQDLGETPAACAERECFEESGYTVRVTELLGVFSSESYEYVHYPWKENEFCHLLFKGTLLGGSPTLSSETTEIGWFSESNLPEFSDGHLARVQFAYRKERDAAIKPHFE